MARHQTKCPWIIELLEAVLIFAAGIAVATLAAATASQRNAGSIVALLGALPALVLLWIGFRLGLTALRNRKAGDEEEETVQVIPPRNQPRGSVRLPAIALAQLKQSRVGGVYSGGGGGGQEECAICLAKVGDDGLATRQLPACGHAFHEHCIEQWLRVHPTCPICRCNARLGPPPEVILRMNNT
ncbi:hypothetical protein PR202_gb22981 [Eleusine coracana subsp. coracana]|uniref:RING-type E3 ubiquitin transferase n=1 Tax=Eleusine coracana subsp. coracana TaxID=191504 RepID=A0AAV5FH49_ELECO|nr:hypothetical protein QOZ80_6BG0484110 [Eleusine coracana subsp. coracana]GJN34331.1 hypothetical protein PR202_gb22981 [Eleusine coracana subsp. coracana]